MQATTIYAEEEVEYEMCRMLDAVKETLTSVNASSGKEDPRMIIWNAPFYDIKVIFFSFYNFVRWGTRHQYCTVHVDKFYAELG